MHAAWTTGRRRLSSRTWPDGPWGGAWSAVLVGNPALPSLSAAAWTPPRPAARFARVCDAFGACGVHGRARLPARAGVGQGTAWVVCCGAGPYGHRRPSLDRNAGRPPEDGHRRLQGLRFGRVGEVIVRPPRGRPRACDRPRRPYGAVGDRTRSVVDQAGAGRSGWGVPHPLPAGPATTVRQPRPGRVRRGVPGPATRLDPHGVPGVAEQAFFAIRALDTVFRAPHDHVCEAG